MSITISFEPPTVGTGVLITNQYAGVPDQLNGFEFIVEAPALPSTSKIPAAGYTCPSTHTPPQDAPGAQVAFIQSSGEFGNVALLGRFNAPHQSVGMLVGGTQDASPWLTAYDINGNLVASNPSAVAAGGSVVLGATSTNPTPDIIFFVLTGADNGIGLWFTDLVYDEVSAAAEDFLLNNLVDIMVAAGGSVTAPSQLTRFGGSDGNIALAITPPPPAGVTLTLTPSTVGGTSDSYSLSVAAAAHAAVGTTNFTLTGAPSSVAVGPQKHTAKGSFTVVQPFTMVVGGGYGSTVALAPCTPAAPLVVELLPSQGLPADTVATITCTGLPPSVICVILQPTVTLSASVSVTLVFSTFQQPAGSAPIPFTVTASIPGFTQTIKGELVVAHTAITSISPFVTTPRAGNPGSTLLISGQGFCQGTRVRFGNDLAMAIPTQITPTLIQVETPRLATTGSLATTGWAGKTPFGIITPDGVAVSGPANWLTQVDSYRNTYGWPFHNYDVNELTFDQLTELYGQNATYINTPFGNVRNPWASIYLATVKAALDGNDLCFGTVLATQRIKNNQWGAVNIGDMPSDNSQFHLPFTWLNPNLTSPNNTPAPQDDFIHVQHIAQYSDEFLGYYLNNSLFATPQSAGTWRTVIEQTFAGNNFPLVCMRKNAGDGHVVVAYDIEENPADPSGYIIDVYDPNEEFTNGEDGDGSGVAHQLAFQLSQILVGGDGSWWFPEDADSWPPPSGTTWSGDVHSIIVCPTQVIPPIPSMPGIASAIWYALEGGAVAVFGSGGATPALREHVTTTAGISTAQLSDSAGRILFLADGSLNTDPATRVAAAPFAVTTGTKGRGDTFVIRPGGAYSHTVRGKSTGSYGIMVVGRKFGVVLTCETVEGQQDTIMLDTGGRAFTFSTGAESAALRAEVMMSGPNGSPHFATLLTRAGSATTHTLRFSADGASVIHDHRGDAAPFEIYLSALNRQGLRHATTSGPLASQDGQTTTLTPADWHDLKAVMLQQTGATTRILTAAPLVASES